MRLSLLLGFLLVWKLQLCHSKEDVSEKLNYHRSLAPPFRKDLYPQEYKVNIPIPLVFSDHVSNSERAAASSSAESKSVEHISPSLLSRKHLKVSEESKEKNSVESSEREHQGRGVLPKLIYYRGANTKHKKKIRKNRPKLTALWGPPRKYKKTHYHPHKSHHHRPHSHGWSPHHSHGRPHHYHGHPSHYHHHHYHHGPPPKKYRPKKTPHIVAIWKENKPGWRPSKHKTFKRVDLLPAYLSDLSYRLKDGLGIISKPNKHGHYGKHGKTPVTYHSGFYTEVQ